MLLNFVVCRLLLARIHALLPWFFFLYVFIQCSSNLKSPTNSREDGRTTTDPGNQTPTKAISTSMNYTSLTSTASHFPSDAITLMNYTSLTSNLTSDLSSDASSTSMNNYSTFASPPPSDLSSDAISTSMNNSTTTWTTLPFPRSTTTFPTVIETWVLSFKITGTYIKKMDDPNSTEHSNLTSYLYVPIMNSCREVLGRAFIRVKLPLIYSKGSILVKSVIELSEKSPQIADTTLWENSLSSTLPGLFIKNSTTITQDSPTQTSPNLAPIIGAVCGVILAILISILIWAIFICQKKIKRKVNAVDQTTTRTQHSVSLPPTNKNLKWRESNGTIAISDSINSQKLFKGQEADQTDRVSLHRPNIERIGFSIDFQPSSIRKDLRLSNPLNEFQQTDQRTSDSVMSLPRIIVSQEEFGTMTTSSTTQSVKVVMSNNESKSSSLLPQRSGVNVKPADFGGLFIPESTSTIGRASSFGLKLNRLNASMQKNEEVQDIDLSSLSNAGDLYSLKPSNSDAKVSNLIKASFPSSLKKLITKDHDAKLHRNTCASLERPTDLKSYSASESHS